MESSRLERLRNALQGPALELRALAIFLHGSRASGTARPDSDLDLAVWLPRGADFEAAAECLAEAASTVEPLSPDRVDVQNLADAPPLFRVRAMYEGTPLYVADRTALARFQATSLCEHWDNEVFLAPMREAMRRRIREGRFAS